MAVTMLMSRRARVCLWLLAGAGFAHLAVAQTLDSHPVFDVGDKWTYRHQNIGDRKDPYTFTNQTYKSEEGSAWLYGESQDPQSARKTFVWRYDYKRGDAMEGFEFDAASPKLIGKRFSNRQKLDDSIQFPLAVGKKYTVTENWNDGNGNTKYDVEVETFEKVKTEAGEFDAYRIKLAGWWTRTGNGSGTGRAEQTIYFAPAVKRIVKSEYVDRLNNGARSGANVRELIKWEPKAPLPAAIAQTVAAPLAPASASQ